MTRMLHGLLLATRVTLPLLATPPTTLAGAVCFLETLGPVVAIGFCAPADPRCLLYDDEWRREGEYRGRFCVVP